MREIVPTKVIAASLGLAGFSVALIAGLAADNPAADIVLRAVVSMFACWAVGLGISAAAGRIIAEHLRKVGAPRAGDAAAAGGAGAAAPGGVA